MTTTTQQAGDVLARLQGFATEIGHRVRSGDEQNAELTEATVEDVRIDASRSEIEAIELDDDWKEIDLEEVGVR